MLKILVFLLSILNLGEDASGNASKIQPELLSLLESGEQVNAIVRFQGGIKSALDKVATLRIADRGERNTAIIESLEKHADVSQGGAVQLLSPRSGGEKGFKYFKQYKSSNILFLKEPTADLIRLLAEDEQVSRIEKEPVFRIIGDIENVTGQTRELPMPSEANPEWNIQQIQVPEAWVALGNRKGDGIVVGHIDTGADCTHEALRDSFAGVEYGWFDAVNGKPEPYEGDRRMGHGTHTLGILAGGKGIGVAPGARWISCMACDSADCKAEHLLDCIQWMECPTLPDGTNRNCGKAPHVVSNSWESVRGETGYNDFIMRWRAMGIIPVFAIGNRGAKCGSTTAPGEMPFVIGVGASNHKNERHYFSGVGPSSEGGLKPDIIAPGVVVFSSSHSGGYFAMSGTSQATPHVAGVIALLKVRNPDLTYDEAFRLITQNTDQNLSVHRWETTCPESDDKYPNNFYGYGLINALKAVTAQTALLGDVAK